MSNIKTILSKAGYYFMGVIMGLTASSLLADPRKIDLTRGGWVTWVFMIMASVVIMLQVIPAIILFTGYLSGLRKKA